jgi:uncharacterized protein YndB with AHSA1/START domain
MGHDWEDRKEVELDATPEQVWEAIATGPGIDSWYMGTTEVEPGEGGTVSTTFGGHVLRSVVTAWDPPHRFAYRGEESPDGRFVAFEFLLEGREGGTTVLRLAASGFLPGDDWEQEYDAMSRAGDMYLSTLVAYATHFPGQTATPITAFGPLVRDWDAAWATLRGVLGLTGAGAEGDSVRFVPAGLEEIEGVVDFLSPESLGVRAEDALYRFVRGFFQPAVIVEHHLFAADVDQEKVGRAWKAWLDEVFA